MNKARLLPVPILERCVPILFRIVQFVFTHSGKFVARSVLPEVHYKEHKQSIELEKYIKCYYSIECEPGVLIEDKAFATGCIEVMFTLSGAPWQTKTNGDFAQTSNIELWGQILQSCLWRRG